MQESETNKSRKTSQKMKLRRATKRKPKIQQAQSAPESLDKFLMQHLDLGSRDVMTETGLARVIVNDSESPLAWLASRKGRDGRPLIDQDQFNAGERLRADFTRGHMSPRVTSSWSGIGRARGVGAEPGEFTDVVVASRQRVRLALEACGPEFAGVLLDVCCFLQGIEDVERARGWPSRSGKVVLQLALDRLARHYGMSRKHKGDRKTKITTWLADDVTFTT